MTKTMQDLREELRSEIESLREKLAHSLGLQSTFEMVWRGNGFVGPKIDGKMLLISNYRRLIEERQSLLDGILKFEEPA